MQNNSNYQFQKQTDACGVTFQRKKIMTLNEIIKSENCLTSYKAMSAIKFKQFADK